MPLQIPMNGNQLLWTPDPRSIQVPVYSFPVVVNEAFYVNQANSNTNSQVRCRGFNTIVDLTMDTSFDYLAENGQVLTWTIGHNGLVPLSCWGVSRIGAGITNMEWFV